MPGATFMIHAPWTANQGNAAAMRQTAAALDAVGESLVAIYAAKTRKSRD